MDHRAVGKGHAQSVGEVETQFCGALRKERRAGRGVLSHLGQKRHGRFGRDSRNPVSGGETGGQIRDQFGQTDPFCPCHGQRGHNRQQAITGHQWGDPTRRGIRLEPQKKPPIGLITHDAAPCPFHRRNHVRGTDPGAVHRPEPQVIHHRVGRYRGADDVCPQEARGKRSQHVTGHQCAGRIHNHRAVGIPIGGDQRIEPVVGTPRLKHVPCFGIHCFGVHGDKAVRSRQPHHFGPKTRQRLDHHIAGHRRMLVDAYAQALQRLYPKCCHIPRHIGRACPCLAPIRSGCGGPGA